MRRSRSGLRERSGRIRLHAAYGEPSWALRPKPHSSSSVRFRSENRRGRLITGLSGWFVGRRCLGLCRLGLAGEAAKFVNSGVRVGFAGRLNAVAHLALAEGRQRFNVDRGDGVNVLKGQTRKVRLHAAEYGDFAVVFRNEVLVLRPVVGELAAESETGKHEEDDQGPADPTPA